MTEDTGPTTKPGDIITLKGGADAYVVIARKEREGVGPVLELARMTEPAILVPEDLREPVFRFV